MCRSLPPFIVRFSVCINIIVFCLFVLLRTNCLLLLVTGTRCFVVFWHCVQTKKKTNRYKHMHEVKWHIVLEKGRKKFSLTFFDLIARLRKPYFTRSQWMQQWPPAFDRTVFGESQRCSHVPTSGLCCMAWTFLSLQDRFFFKEGGKQTKFVCFFYSSSLSSLLLT